MKSRRCKNVRAHTSSRGWSYLVNAPRKGGQLVCGKVFCHDFFLQNWPQNCEMHWSQYIFFINYHSFISRHCIHFRLSSPNWKRLDSVPKQVNEANALLAWISAIYSVRTLPKIEQMTEKIQTTTHPHTREIESEQGSGERWSAVLCACGVRWHYNRFVLNATQHSTFYTGDQFAPVFKNRPSPW